MKQVTIQISHASRPVARILVDGEKLQAPKLRISKEEEASRKPQAASLKMDTIK